MEGWLHPGPVRSVEGAKERLPVYYRFGSHLQPHDSDNAHHKEKEKGHSKKKADDAVLVHYNMYIQVCL